MKITIKYFGEITEKTGAEIENRDFETPEMEIQELISLLAKEYNFHSLDQIRFAHNQKFVTEGKLVDGDELAILPPFSGG